MKKLCLMLASVILAFGACDFIGMEEPEKSEQTDDKNDDGKDEDPGENNGGTGDENGGENGEENGGENGGENGDVNPGDDNTDNGNDGDGSSDATTVLEPDQQKVKLEEIAENLLDEYPAEDFKDLFSLADRFAEKYLENVSDSYWDPFFEYCEERGEDMILYTESESSRGGEIYRESTLEGFLEFSQFHGLLTLGPSSATCEDYDGTKVVFDLGNDNYVVELTTSGKTTKATYRFEDIYGYSEYTGNGYWIDDYTWVDEYVLVHVNDQYKLEADVPEMIKLSIRKNGKDFAVADIKFEVNFTKEGVDITTDCLKVSATVEIDGNTVVLEKSGYDGSTGEALVSFTLKKEGQNIIRAHSSANVKYEIIKETNDWGEQYAEYAYPEFHLAKDFNIFVDVLGQLQFRASCVDGLKVAEYVENFYDAGSLNVVERAIDNINNYVKCALYYDGSNVCQAEVVMDYYVEKDDYYGDEWYELDPIIVFPDGSKYAFYEYFKEDSFDGVITSFELWIELYETMLEHYFG